MKKSHLFILPVILSLSVLFCQNNSDMTTKRNTSIPDSASFSLAMLDAVNASDSTNFSLLQQVYLPRAYNSFWFNNTTKFNERILLLDSFLQHADEHGLTPGRFGAQKILDLLSKTDTTNIDYQHLAQLEIQATQSYYSYCSGLQYGCYNPVKLYPDDYFIAPRQPDSAFIRQIFSNPDSLRYYLRSVQPVSGEYKILQAELRKIRKLSDSTFRHVPLMPADEQIKLNRKHPSVPLIARRLMISGELPFRPKWDSIYTRFDEHLLKALNQFRKQNNLIQDNEIGNPTISALNINFKKRSQIVAINLERLRWKPKNHISNKFVEVNVANMMLRTMRGDTVTNTMKVCVGQPPKHKTPLLYGKMYEVVLNPTWTVPSSIIINEISRKMISDPSYISRNRMKVYKNREAVSEYSVPWSSISKKYQPYVIVQDAGEGNSLGRIKFNFSNPFNVYLHDTNAKSVFQRHYRAVSHGCVRVERPLELAYFCMNDIDTTSKKQVNKRNLLKDQILYSIDRQPLTRQGREYFETEGKGKKMSRIELNPGVTVLLDYKTCFRGKDGSVQYCYDHYKMDSLLINKLFP
ncbi:MAG TPA: L,D-transpeptidase family protein [Paludibacteraceae bacterium]|nr:L,D-transpeptidase family protein [Paludibacteraceae bacterium]